MKSLALALLLIPASLPTTQAMRYTPGSARYSQSIVITSPATLVALGIPAEIKSRLILSTQITRLGTSADSLRLMVTVDSSEMSGGEALNRSGQVVPPGTKVERKMTAWGKSIPSASENQAAGQIIASIIPVLMNGARLGSAWEDTIPVDLLGVSAMLRGVNGRMARSFLVSKDTTYEGEAAWKINVGMTTTVTGSSSGGSLPFGIDGGGEGTGMIILGKNGVLLYSTENQALNLNLRLQAGGSAGGTSFPIETTTARTVRRIK